MMKINNNSINYVLFSILIISQIFGLYGGMLQAPRVFSILFLPFLLKNLSNYDLKQKNIGLFFLSVLIHCLLSTFIYSINSDDIMKDFTYGLVNFIIFLEIVNFSKKLSLYQILNAWVLFISMTIPIALVEINFNYHFSNSKFGHDNFLGGIGTLRQYAAITFGNYNLYNFILASSFPFILIKLRLVNSIIKKIFIIIVLLSIVYIILSNASRGAILCVFISFLLFILFYSNKTYKTRLFYSISTLFLIGGAIFFLFQGNTFFFLKSRLENKGFEDNSRLEMIEIGYEMFVKSNMFGVGSSNFSNYARRMTTSEILAPHNLFIEILSQYGIVVFVFFIMLLINIFSFKRIFKNRKIESYILICALLILPVSTTINSVYLTNPFLWIYLATLYTISLKLDHYVHRNIR